MKGTTHSSATLRGDGNDEGAVMNGLITDAVTENSRSPRSRRLVETALQAAMLGMLTLLVHHEQALPPLLLMAVGSTFVKAIVIPWMLGSR